MSKYEKAMNYSSELNLKDVILEDENIIWEGKPKKSAFVINKCLKDVTLSDALVSF